MELEKAYTGKCILDYMSEYYLEIEETHGFGLMSLHKFYNTYQPPASGATFNYWLGPVLCDLISTSPKCKEIVFAEFADDCREQVNLWLKKNPSAYDW